MPLNLTKWRPVLERRRPLAITGFSGTSYLSRLTGDYGSYPHYVLARVIRRSNAAAFHSIFSCQDGTAAGIGFDARMANTEAFQLGTKNDALTTGFANSPVSVLNRWYVVLFAWRASNNRFISANGETGTGTASVATPITVANEAIGVRVLNTVQGIFTEGEIGPITVLTSEPNAAQLIQLLQGKHEAEVLDPATIKRAYWPYPNLPMGFDLSEAVAHMTVTGTGLRFAPGPPIVLPGRRRAFKVPFVTETINLDDATLTWDDQALGINAKTQLGLDDAAFPWSAEDLGVAESSAVNLDDTTFAWSAQALAVNAKTAITLEDGVFTFSPQALGVVTGEQIDLAAAAFQFSAKALGLNAVERITLDDATFVWQARALGLNDDPVATLAFFRATFLRFFRRLIDINLDEVQ